MIAYTNPSNSLLLEHETDISKTPIVVVRLSIITPDNVLTPIFKKVFLLENYEESEKVVNRLIPLYGCTKRVESFEIPPVVEAA